METIKNTSRIKYRIPGDLLIEVLRILYQNNINNKITGVKENESMVIMKVMYSESKNNTSAKENIETLLNEYTAFMKGLLTDKTLFMDEEAEQEDDNY